MCGSLQWRWLYRDCDALMGKVQNMKMAFAIFGAWLALSASASAQSTATPVQTGFLATTGCPYAGQTACFIQYGPGFNASGQTTLTATTSSSRVALPSTGATVVVSNAGPSTAYVALGGSTVTATTSSIPVISGFPVTLFATNTQTFLAGITASSTAVLTITTGSGVPNGASVGGTTSNGNVNLTGINGTAPSTTNPLYVDESLTGNFHTDLIAPLTAGNNIIGQVKIVDVGGTNQATVKPASTASVDGDTRLVIDSPPTGTLVSAINGPIPAGTASIGTLNPATNAVTAALASSQVVKASAGTLYSFDVSADSTLSGAAWWVMVFNATSAPADGAVTPAKCYAMPSGATTLTAAFAPGGTAFSTGITIVTSTTGCFSKTASAHAFISGDFL